MGAVLYVWADLRAGQGDCQYLADNLQWSSTDGEIFPAAQLITVPFPAELLPYVGKCQPTHLYALDSAGCENLGSHFILHKIHWPAWLEGGDYHG